MSSRTLQLSNFWYKLLMLTKNIKYNDMVKEDVEGFCEFHLSLLFCSNFLFTWHLPIACEKVNWQNCFKFLILEIGHSLFRLWGFSATKPYVIRLSLSTVFVLLHLDSGTHFLQNISFDLLSKWLLNLELIPSSQRQNGNGDSQNSVYSFWSTVDMNNFIILSVVCIALTLFLPMCIYWDRHIVICFKEVLKEPNGNLLTEQIKLQCLCSLEPKNISGTSKIKTKLEETFASKCWFLVNKYIAQKCMINKFPQNQSSGGVL